MLNKLFKKLLLFGIRLIYKDLGFFHINAEQTNFVSYEDFVAQEDFKKISSISRYTQSDLLFLGKKFTITDNAAFFGMVDEIFIKNNYMFLSDNPRPYIIDCGANIGLASIFFKRVYPEAQILSIEPDPYVFGILKENINSFGFNDIVLHNSAVWINNDKLLFSGDKSWGGHIVNKNTRNSIEVNAIDLNDILIKPVDFLKIDIEGAETEVLWHSKDLIVKYVKNLFFEWHSLNTKNQRLGELLFFFEQNGYRYHIKEAYPKGAPFIEKRLDLEMDTQLDCFLYKK